MDPVADKLVRLVTHMLAFAHGLIDTDLNYTDLGLGQRCDSLDLRRAVFEFRDLPERVELRIGQDVGRGLRKSEGNKDHPGWNRLIDARLELDRAAARGDADEITRFYPEPFEIACGQGGDRLRLQVVESLAAPRHRARMPVLELPPS